MTTPQPFVGIGTLSCGHAQQFTWWAREPKRVGVHCRKTEHDGVRTERGTRARLVSMEVIQEAVVPVGLAASLAAVDRAIRVMDLAAVSAVKVMNARPEQVAEMHNLVGSLAAVDATLRTLRTELLGD